MSEAPEGRDEVESRWDAANLDEGGGRLERELKQRGGKWKTAFHRLEG